MNKNIAKIYRDSLEKYKYSDCDGDNNIGVRLNEEEFAVSLIKEAVRLTCKTWVDDHSVIPCPDATSVYKHFGIE